jgi:DNA invertase Pin-like site-specific DNA recombinase
MDQTKSKFVIPNLWIRGAVCGIMDTVDGSLFRGRKSMNRTDAIYGRQSLDKKDSISIESQIEFCRHELRGGEAREYIDKGFSGKNTDRPQFQQLVKDIESGLIRRVIVYRLDRISRSILDFAKMMEMFQKYNVEFVSSTEKFDTSAPIGRAMLNICIVFAQLERESIQQRITDAYYSRSQKGFLMGGKTPYGYRTEPFVMDGVRTKRLVIEPTESAMVRQMYEMYAKPEVSYRDIINVVTEQGMRTSA